MDVFNNWVVLVGTALISPGCYHFLSLELMPMKRSVNSSWTSIEKESQKSGPVRARKASEWWTVLTENRSLRSNAYSTPESFSVLGYVTHERIPIYQTREKPWHCMTTICLSTFESIELSNYSRYTVKPTYYEHHWDYSNAIFWQTLFNASRF